MNSKETLKIMVLASLGIGYFFVGRDRLGIAMYILQTTFIWAVIVWSIMFYDYYADLDGIVMVQALIALSVLPMAQMIHICYMIVSGQKMR